MKPAQFAVIVQEHDSTPWDDGHLFTRAGAWARVQSMARDVVPGWPHPIFIKVWRITGARKVRTCVYTGDLREVKQ